MTGEIAAFCRERLDEEPDLWIWRSVRSLVRWATDRADLAEGRPGMEQTGLAAEAVLRHVAAIWQSHPDYQPRWAP